MGEGELCRLGLKVWMCEKKKGGGKGMWVCGL